jgi:Glycosyl transferases group 1
MSEPSQLRQFVEESAIEVSTVPVRVSFSYNGARRHPTENYLSSAFSPGYATYFDFDFLRADESVLTLLEVARNRGEMPEAFAHLVDTPAFPRDMQRSPVPTVSLDIDSFGWTSSRIRWSMLFDYVFIWHPSFVPMYKEAGHPKVFALPHAADATLFSKNSPVADRSFDLGWVGAFDYQHYNKRRRIIEGLADRYKMNEFRRHYTKEETAEVYMQSKIVVNVSREDFPQEANMRCYEAMAGGALLITGIPTELTEWGFREGEHFLGWREEGEIQSLVDHYLHDEKARGEIAHTAQELTLSDFTFQKCRDKISYLLREHPNEFFAPARNWTPDEVGLIYLEHHYRHQLFEPALTQFCGLKNLAAYWKGLPMMLKTAGHFMQGFC